MKKTGKKYDVGITFGAFEYFHYGHVNLLKNAKKFCNKLIVCVSDDEYIKTHKNHTPAMSWMERKTVVEAIKYVDRVEKQSNKFSKADAVKKHKPDVLLVGNDWTPETYTGEGLGVPVIYLPYTKSISSTKLRLILGNKKCKGL